MRLLFLAALAVSTVHSTLGCGTSKAPPTPAPLPAAPEAASTDDAQDSAAHAEPRPDVPVGTQLTAYVGPRFITGEPFVPEAHTVVADETGRVRMLLKGPPPPGYAVVTLPGKLAVAGLHDAHIHIQGVGQARDQVDLLGAKSPAECKKRVAAWVKAHPEAAVVRGRGWDQSLFPGNKFPTSKDLEGATTKPVLLDRVDGHAAWANGALLTLAAITKDTKDPAGGRIERDAKGEPTGVFVDNAIELVEKKLPAPSPADVERWLVAGMNACADAGLVAVHDMGMNVEAAQVLARLDDAGKLPLRVFVYLDGTQDASYAYLGQRKPTPRLEIMGVKLYADGAMGSRGAALLAPYADDPANSGLLVTEPATLAERIKRVHDKGFAAAVHAIGDRGNRTVLDAMKSSPAPAGTRDRIEHSQLVAPEDFQRFFDEHVVASMQPTHATSDMRWAEARVGKERVKGAYAWKTMLEHGVMLAFGSDAPVESEKPAWGIYAAITRQDHAGAPKEGFTPEQRMTQHQALVGFSTGAAYAVSHERDLGALTPGMFFDVTLFTEDVAAKDPKAWINAKPAGTVVGAALRKVP